MATAERASRFFRQPELSAAGRGLRRKRELVALDEEA
jgi:hypothetical protein